MTASHSGQGSPTEGEAEAFGLVLGQVIAQLRKQHGDMTQSQLAARLGISQSALSKIEAGKRPDAFLYGLIARTFGLKVQELDRQVQEAMRRTKEAAAAATHKKPSTSWGELLALAGFVGLVVFAVAAVLGEDESPEKEPPKPTPRQPSAK